MSKIHTCGALTAQIAVLLGLERVFKQKRSKLPPGKLFRPIISLYAFSITLASLQHSYAENANLNWNISATATETRTASGSGIEASAYRNNGPCSQGDEAYWTYNACYDRVTMSAPYNASCSCTYEMTNSGSQTPYGVVTVTTSSALPPSGGTSAIAGSASAFPKSGTLNFSMTGNSTYYVYAFIRSQYGGASINCSWTASETANITGQDNGNSSFELRSGEQTVSGYAIQWNNSQGGSRAITSFNFSGSFSPSSLAPRLSARADPTYSETGSIKVTFSNSQPNTNLLSPANQADIEDNTPNFEFSYSDPNGDAQQAFQLQIGTDSQLQNLVFDSGNIQSTATTYQLPSSSSLTSQTTYYWRVRTRDIYAGSSEWGSYSSIRSFTNTTAPDVRLSHGSTEIAQSGYFDFPEVNRGELADATLTIANDGSADLTIDSINLSTADTFYITEPTSFPVVMQPGQSTNLGMRYVPAEIGAHSAVLHIVSNDPDESPFVVDIFGSCIDWAFRYKQYLYSRDGDYIYGKLDNMSQYWGDLERAEALVRISEYTQNLQADPSNSGLRWALLDVYYDIAVAELMVSQEKTIEALQSSLGLDPQVGVTAINREITLLEEAKELYGKGLKVYFDLLQDPLGIDTSVIDPSVTTDMPFGYYIFRAEVPSRSLYSPLRRNALGEYVLPGEPADGSLPVEVHGGYKDLMLLMQLEKEYVKTAAKLTKLYLLSNYSTGAGVSTEARDLIGAVLQASCTEVGALLNCFGIDVVDGPWIDLPNGMEESVKAWQTAISELTHYHTYLAGETDPLGFPTDILVLLQSQTPGDPASQYFDSYDFLASYLTNSAAGGPLAVANQDWATALSQYQNYRDRQDQLASQLSQSRFQFGERLRQIVGVNYGEPGYDDLFGHTGSELALQSLHIQLAQAHLTSIQTRIEAVNTQIGEEIERRGRARGIHDAIRKVYLDYGDKGALVIEEIASIASTQSYLQNCVGDGHSRRSEIANLVELQGLRQAALHRLAAEERAEVSAVETGLLDAESATKIKNLIIEMQTLYLDSIEAAIQIRLQQGKLDALLSEKASLEALWTQYNSDLADRYFADPAHRLVKDFSLIKAELSFELAQRWLSLTAQALEYKWNTPFSHVYNNREYTPSTVFELRNAQELTDLYNAMSDWNISISVGDRNDDNYKKFSVRRDFLDLGDDFQAFRDYLSTGADILEANDPANRMSVRALRIGFSTVREEALFFRQERWLEKIDFMRVMVLGGVLSGIDAFIDGYLTYGGTSYLRNRTPGTQDPDQPDRIIDEMTDYPVRYLYFDPIYGWQTNDTLGSYIAVQVTVDEWVPPGAYQINTFKELSVAGSEWNLFIALEDPNGDPVLNLSEVVDIEIHFAFYWHNRD